MRGIGSGMRLRDARIMRILRGAPFLVELKLMEVDRPAYRELDLPDLEAFKAAASAETLSALREFACPTHYMLKNPNDPC